MPWPKGVPRTGYVTKSGEAHKPKGKHRPIEERQTYVYANAVIVMEPVRKSEPQPEIRKTRKWTTPLSHPTYSIEQCPDCDFPEADGGYCPECGWSQPVVYGVKF